MWAALEDACHPPRRLVRENNPVGVFAGVMNSGYEWMGGHAAASEWPTRPARTRVALAVKADGSMAVDQVFGTETLDFLVFFSSMGALAGTAGNGTYSCAAALQDAYALHLAHRCPYPVRVIDWGYWGPVGSGARHGLREIFRDLGIGELSVAEGLPAVGRVLGNRLPQVLAITADGVTSAWWPTWTPLGRPVEPEV